MKTSIIELSQFAYYIDSVPDNTFFLCINHKYDTDKRYMIYHKYGVFFEKFFDTNSKEELKIWMDLMGYNLLRNFLIKNHCGDKFEIRYDIIELSKVS